MTKAKRQKYKRVMLSNEECIALECYAADAGCTVSEYIRATLIYRQFNPVGDGKKIPSNTRNFRGDRIIDWQVMLTPEERNLLLQNAELAGCTPSELIRRTAVYGRNLKILDVPKIDLSHIAYEQKKIGTNINQIARLFNTYGVRDFDTKLLTNTVKEGQALIEQIGELVSSINKWREGLNDQDGNVEGR